MVVHAKQLTLHNISTFVTSFCTVHLEYAPELALRLR